MKNVIAKKFVMLAVGAVLSFAPASAQADDAPRQLEPRYALDSASAPSKGKRPRSPSLTSSAHYGDCARLFTLDERNLCAAGRVPAPLPVPLSAAAVAPKSADGDASSLLAVAAQPIVIGN